MYVGQTDFDYECLVLRLFYRLQSYLVHCDVFDFSGNFLVTRTGVACYAFAMFCIVTSTNAS